MWNDILFQKIDKENSAQITVSSKQLNYAIGYKGKNRNELLSKGYNVKFTADKCLKDFEINVCYN